MPFSLFLAQKYLKPKRSVTSVITCVSVLGVLLGVAVVIIVRAVMTGFGDLWERRYSISSRTSQLCLSAEAR